MCVTASNPFFSNLIWNFFCPKQNGSFFFLEGDWGFLMWDTVCPKFNIITHIIFWYYYIKGFRLIEGKGILHIIIDATHTHTHNCRDWNFKFFLSMLFGSNSIFIKRNLLQMTLGFQTITSFITFFFSIDPFSPARIKAR